MTPPDQSPKLPAWIFFLTDAVLLFTAWYIAGNSARPLSGNVILSILACVIVGALIATVPLIAYYERVKNETLDERQRALESLSLTVAASAEQISIATHGLHEIAEIAQRNLKAAEQLPAKLQEKIAGLKSQPDSPRDGEREELKKELARLRASESERLQSAADKIAKATVELSRLAAARPEPAERVRPERLEAPAAAAPPVPAAASEPASAPTAEAAPPPKRTRKPRPEEPDLNPKAEVHSPLSEEPPPIPTATIPEVVPVAPGSTPPIETNHTDAPAPAPVIAEAPPPKLERKRAPKKPRPDAPAAEVSGSENPKPEEPAFALAESGARPEPAEPAARAVERVVSSDGATRLLVTAYIGIGNRLFIRGAGPGLSWDKGLPLQFVSIGKWRWETNDATAPVQFKLYKNDDSECAALGTQTLDPGQQEEVTATF